MSDVNIEKKLEATKAGAKTLASITTVLDLILSAFEIPKVPVTPLPPALILSGGKLKPGLIPSEITSRIITRQTEAGGVAGDVYDDGVNIAELMELIRVEEIIGSILLEAKVEIVIPPGIPVVVTSINAPGPPITSVGQSVAIASGWGVVR